jgi:hypothetical protein
MENLERQRIRTFHRNHAFTRRFMVTLGMLLILAVTLSACTFQFVTSRSRQKSTYPAEITNVADFKFVTDQTEYGSQVKQNIPSITRRTVMHFLVQLIRWKCFKTVPGMSFR